MRAVNSNEIKWDDLRVVPGAFQFAGSADPSLVNWQPGGSGREFKVYAFIKNDVVYASCQMPHSYKEGSDFYFHIHWTPKDRGNEESGNYVGWKVDYSISDIDEVFPSSSTVSLSSVCSGVDHQHEVSTDFLISGSSFKISNIILLAIYRSDTGTDDTWVGTTAAQSPALLEFDIHFQIDDRGSTGHFIK